MSRICPRPRNIVLILDQNAASLRDDDGSILGIDLFSSTKTSLTNAEKRGAAVHLALPVAKADTIGTQIMTADGRGVMPLDPHVAAKSASFQTALPGDALIAADRKLRGQAAKAGMLALPHIAALEMTMQREIPQAIRVAGQKDVLAEWARKTRAIPMHFQPAQNAGWAMIALVNTQGLTQAVLAGLEIATLPYDVTTHDLFWVRIDDTDAETQKALNERQILYAEKGQILLALGPDEDSTAIKLHGQHGHNEFVFPNPSLLATPATEDAFAPPSRITSIANLDLSVAAPLNIADPIRLRPQSCASITAQYENDLDRYSGIADLDVSGPIVSRHIAHPDNARVEAQLIRDLRAIGYCPQRHNFQHAGQTYSNITADLAGTGRFVLKPSLRDKWRDLLRDLYPTLTEPLRTALHASAAEQGRPLGDISKLAETQLQQELTDALHFHPWFPWWCQRAQLAGIGAGLVILGCHFDSSANFSSGFDPTSDPAPGRDDNGSGIAATLSAARHMASMRGKLTHTVRFSFFNAEEAGLIGSKAYAATLKAQNAPVRQVICTDMIGYNSNADRQWEIHAGYSDPNTRDISLPVADAVASAASIYGALPSAQIYRGTSSNTGAPNRDLYDGAINRSDHASFHQQGYPAALVSEDFFVNQSGEPQSDPNPNYHRNTDTFVDIDYARDITCAITHAVVTLAK